MPRCPSPLCGCETAITIRTEGSVWPGWTFGAFGAIAYCRIGREVDIVLENPLGHLAGIEIKISETVSASDFTGIRALAEAAGEDFLCGVVLYLGNGVHKIGQNLAAMPISSLWV